MNEFWKDLEELDGIFQISNKGRIHQSEYEGGTISTLGGKLQKLPFTEPEKYFDFADYVNGVLKVRYKQQTHQLNIKELLYKYFDKEELELGKKDDSKEHSLEKEFNKVKQEYLNKVEDSENEDWKPIPNYEGYMGSTKGRIKRLSYIDNMGNRYPEDYVSPYPKENRRGWFVKLWNGKSYDELLVAKIIATIFVPNPRNFYYVRHIDGHPYNNHAVNLQWHTEPSKINLECVETGKVYNSYKAICKEYHISKKKLLTYIKEHKPIRDDVTFVEQKTRYISSSGVRYSGKMIKQVKPLIDNSVNIRKTIKEKSKVTNPIKSQTVKSNIKTASTSITTETKSKPTSFARFKEIKDFPNYKVSTDGYIIRNAGFNPNGYLRNESIESTYEKNGALFCKLMNESGVHEKQIDRIVAEVFNINLNDYYVLNHKDGDLKNLNYTNLEWVPTKVNLYNSETSETKLLEEVAKSLGMKNSELYTEILETGMVRGVTYQIVEESTPIVHQQVNNVISEDYKEIKYFENYLVSTSGHIYLKDENGNPGQKVNPVKYEGPWQDYFVILSNANHTIKMPVAQIVANAFLDNPNGWIWVNHKNEKYSDNSVSNLEFIKVYKQYDRYIKVFPYGYVYHNVSRAIFDLGLTYKDLDRALKDGIAIKGLTFVEVTEPTLKAPIKNIEAYKSLQHYMNNGYVEQPSVFEKVTETNTTNEESNLPNDVYKVVSISDNWALIERYGSENEVECFVSKKGEVKKFKFKQEVYITIKPDKYGVKRLSINGHCCSVAHLVAEKWLPNPNKEKFKYVKHRGDKSDDSLENLYWADNVLGSEVKNMRENVIEMEDLEKSSPTEQPPKTAVQNQEQWVPIIGFTDLYITESIKVKQLINEDTIYLDIKTMGNGEKYVVIQKHVYKVGYLLLKAFKGISYYKDIIYKDKDCTNLSLDNLAWDTNPKMATLQVYCKELDLIFDSIKITAQFLNVDIEIVRTHLRQHLKLNGYTLERYTESPNLTVINNSNEIAIQATAEKEENEVIVNTEINQKEKENTMSELANLTSELDDDSVENFDNDFKTEFGDRIGPGLMTEILNFIHSNPIQPQGHLLTEEQFNKYKEQEILLQKIKNVLP